MTLDEARQRVAQQIMAAFPHQQNRELSDCVDVRIDEDPGVPGAFQAIIHAPNAASHLRARLTTMDALRGEHVTF